jgi:hypothetical protein
MKYKIIKNEFEQLKKTYLRKGLKPLLTRIFDYFLMQFIAIGFTYELDLDKIQYIPSNQDFIFENIDIHALDRIYDEYKSEINEKIYQDILKKIKNPIFEGFIVKKNGKICSYCFIKYENIKKIYEKNTGHLLTDYVFNKYRNQKIQQYGIYRRLMVLKQKNFKTATGVVERYNYPSRSSFEKFGFKKCSISYFFKFGNRRLSNDYFFVLKNK